MQSNGFVARGIGARYALVFLAAVVAGPESRTARRTPRRRCGACGRCPHARHLAELRARLRRDALQPAASRSTRTTSQRLGLAWSYDTGALRGLEATPLVANGVLYATTSWSDVFALDARTGALLWKWDARADRVRGARACCDVVNRGVALYDGKVYVGIVDGRLAALDAATGKPVWDVQTTPVDEPYTITGAPRVVDGKVIIGNGGAELGVRGYVSAYDAQTGALVWRFYTVPGDPSKPFESPALEAAAKTWTGEWWTMGGGGTAWDAFAYDPDEKLLYVGTGNGSPWDRNIAAPAAATIFISRRSSRCKVETGELVWHYQTTPGDIWDYTAVQQLTLADMRIGGRERKVIMQAPKNGFFYVLDRLTGELLSADPIARVTWASGVDLTTGRPIETPQARYTDALTTISPGPGGAHNWQPMAYSPATGLVYIPVSESSFSYGRDTSFTFRPRFWNLGIDLAASTGMGRTGPVRPQSDYSAGTGEAAGAASSLLAWDPVAKRARVARAAHRRHRRRHADDGRQPRVPGHRYRQARRLSRRHGSEALGDERRHRHHGRAEHVFDRRHAIRRRARRHGRRDGALRPQPDEPVQGHGTCVHVRARRPRAGAARARPRPAAAGADRERRHAGRDYTRRRSLRPTLPDVPRRRSPERRLDRRPALRGAGHDRRVRAHRARRRVRGLGMPMFDWLTDADVAALRGYVLSRRAALLAAPAR